MKHSVLVWSCCAALLLSACDGGGPDATSGGGVADAGGASPSDGGGGGGAPDSGGGGAPDGGGGGAPDGGGTQPPTTLTVTGKVVSGTGYAETDITVLIPGEGRQPVQVDDSGTFRVSGVKAPYDLLLVHKERRFAFVYKGLTLQGPTLALDEASTNRSGRIEGTVTGQQSSTEPNRTQVSFSSPDIAEGSEQVEASGGYSLSAFWRGDWTSSGTLYALQSAGGQGYPFTPPTSYLAFGQRDNVSAQYFGTVRGQDIVLKPVTTAHLEGDITLPADYDLTRVALSFVPGTSSPVALFGDEDPTPTFRYAVPQLSQATFSMKVSARAKSTGGSGEPASLSLFKQGLRVGDARAALVLPEAARPTLPANDAKDVTPATAFSWTPFAQGVHGLILEERYPQGRAYRVMIYQRETQTTLPDLSGLGLALPANTEFTWHIEATAPMASVDDLVQRRAKGSLSEGVISVSEERTLTTAVAP